MTRLVIAFGVSVERVAPRLPERCANGGGRNHGVGSQRSGDGGDDQADGEDGAAMGVDAAGDGQHSALGLDAERDEALVERPPGSACRGKRHEGGQQRVGRPAHQVEIHVGVSAGIDGTDEAGFGVGLQLVAHRRDRGAGNRLVVQAHCPIWERGTSFSVSTDFRRTSSLS